MGVEIPDSVKELLRAARVLFRERIGEEEQIIPTLEFARQVSLSWALRSEKDSLVRAWPNPDSWSYEAEVFAARHPTLRPLKVVDDILVLERLPVYVHVHIPIYETSWDQDVRPSDRARADWDTEIVVAVYPHSKPAKGPQVAVLYGQAASTNGLPVGKSEAESISLERRDSHALIILEHKDKSMPPTQRGLTWRPLFPPPERVGWYYETLMGSSAGQGLASQFFTRKRGPTLDPYNLIPACVAYYLNGPLGSRSSVHKALNEHVLLDTHKQLEVENRGSSTQNQIWRTVSKVAARLHAAGHLLFNTEPEWIASHNRFRPKKMF